MRWRNLVIIFLLLAASSGWWLAGLERAKAKAAEFTQRKLAFLEKENGRLSDQLARQVAAQETAADAQQRSDIERSVTRLRELPFVRPITYRQIPRSELPTVLRKKLLQQVPDREFEDSVVALAALGLLPPGIDLKKTYLGLLGEQIGAFYDQHTQEVFTFSGQPLSNGQNRVILAHELTHALEDQHFRLADLPLEAKGNDDRAMAASALVEGDATLVMNRYLLQNLSGTVLKDTLASSFTTDVRQLAAAPHYLRENLLFPYLKGLVFCQELFDRGGWTALAEAFRHPPNCTAQILHPERYLENPSREPIKIEFLSTTVLGQKPLVDNVLGEFGIRQILKIWLQDDRSIDIASGWEGDRYLVFGARSENSYLWRSVWSSEVAAQKFAGAARDGWQNRYRIGPAEPSQGSEVAGQVGQTILSRCLPNGRELRIFRKAREVTLVEAQDVAWLDAISANLQSK